MIEQITNIIKYIFESNIINFILMVWFFAWIFKKIDIKSLFSDAINSVENYIKKSEQDKAKSVRLVESAQYTLSKLPSQISEIQRISKQKTDILLEKMEENTKQSVEKINKNISKIKAIEEDKASNSVTEYAFKQSIEQASSNIIEMLKNNPQLHEKFINESLEQLEKLPCQ